MDAEFFHEELVEVEQWNKRWKIRYNDAWPHFQYVWSACVVDLLQKAQFTADSIELWNVFCGLFDYTTTTYSFSKWKKLVIQSLKYKWDSGKRYKYFVVSEQTIHEEKHVTSQME
jgi:hypothetical protein